MATVKPEVVAAVMERVLHGVFGKHTTLTPLTHYLEDVIFVLLGVLRGLQGGLYVDAFIEAALNDKDPLVVKTPYKEEGNKKFH